MVIFEAASNKLKGYYSFDFVRPVPQNCAEPKLTNCFDTNFFDKDAGGSGFVE
jgi:hypothetical protein